MITNFKLFESNNIIFDNNSYWVIYGDKRSCANILISLLNDGIIKNNDLIREIRQKITMIENSLYNDKNKDIIGIFIYNVDNRIALSYFSTELEKKYNMKTYYKDSIFRGELKMNSYGKIILDTIEADTIKYNL